MAILPQERSFNYVASLWNYIEGRYTTTEKYFYGLNTLDTTKLDEWVQFSWDVGYRDFYRQTDQGSEAYPGNLVHVNVVTNIYVKPSDVLLRITQIKDELIGLLRRAIVDVRDWAGSKNIISQLWGNGIVQELFLDTQDEIDQYQVTFDYSYVEQFERAHR